ncbi:hypothetical protein AMRN_1115 [Malaciobacter marinus]|nr:MULTISPECIES: hypothetical protein [Malaciobacter]RYA23830.1 hypothetical protein CRU96_06210 [Malaciobacter halophilus]AXX86863.1 hypothetical protein AMRN_1115 [Malaciobacter marinus]PHO10161.1 hypothetical protein CPG37_05685 [Malaciobacter canalis]PHO13012.1 hypothetical protein CPG38_04550 [Malaciobacter marinus]PHO15820.1 hypothetical protein CPH92_04415 [Malaciobacter marinus]
MEIIKALDSKIEKLIHDYERIRIENDALRQELNQLKNTNDELVRNNQDMLLRIDSAITLTKGKNSDAEIDFSY